MIILCTNAQQHDTNAPISFNSARTNGVKHIFDCCIPARACFSTKCVYLVSLTRVVGLFVYLNFHVAQSPIFGETRILFYKNE